MGKPKVAPEVKEEKQGTKKAKCHCVQAYQDSLYGRGVRVWNKTAKTGEYRCTGCGTTRVL